MVPVFVFVHLNKMPETGGILCLLLGRLPFVINHPCSLPLWCLWTGSTCYRVSDGTSSWAYLVLLLITTLNLPPPGLNMSRLSYRCFSETLLFCFFAPTPLWLEIEKGGGEDAGVSPSSSGRGPIHEKAFLNSVHFRDFTAAEIARGWVASTYTGALGEPPRITPGSLSCSKEQIARTLWLSNWVTKWMPAVQTRPDCWVPSPICKK